MHIVGNQALNTRNDAQVTRRVSRVVFHNDYNDATSVNNESHHSLFSFHFKCSWIDPFHRYFSY